MKKKYAIVIIIAFSVFAVILMQHQEKNNVFVHLHQYDPVFKIKPSETDTDDEPMDLTKKEIYNYISSFNSIH